MQRMSFMLTKDQILNQTKDVTRRLGWVRLRAGDVFQPVYKCQGLKAGEHQELLGGPAMCVSNDPEVLMEMRRGDCRREGFSDLTPMQFVALFCREMRCEAEDTVNRIEFRYL